MNRITSIDFARGLVMVIMALDHTRDLVHVSATTADPLDLQTTHPALFFTRWITHLCAPIFVFLSGTSAYLSAQNSGDPVANRWFQLKRGLWLIFLNFTLVNFGIFMDPHFGILFHQVISAIGFGFVFLALLMGLPARTLGMIGLIIVAGHHLVQGIQWAPGSAAQFIWSFLFNAGAVPLGPDRLFVAGYAIIPWLGIMLCGYATGVLFQRSSADRRALFLKIGLGALVLFVALRTWNIYGDAAHWVPQKDLVFSALSFINLSKYPPSFQYALVMLGLLFVGLWAFDQTQNRFTQLISVYGKVPLLYYLVHWFVIHFFLAAVLLAQGYTWADMDFSGFNFGRPKSGGGLELGGVYAVWLSVVALLYPVCQWFWAYKSSHREKTWLRYL
jgi:uncharacterized membrane protein